MNDFLLAQCFQLAFEHAARLAESEDWHVRLLLAENPLVDAEVLAKLAEDENEKVRDAARINPATPWHLQEALAGAKRIDTYGQEFWTFWETEEIRYASLPNTPKKLLTDLSKSQFVKVRASVASNEATSLATLNRLVQDESEQVRAAVAANPKLSRSLYKMLIGDVPFVVKVLATNPRIHETTVKQLIFHPNDEVRAEIAKNQKVPVLFLRMLVANDASINVREHASKTLWLLGDNYGSEAKLIPDFDASNIQMKEFAFIDHRPKVDAIAMHAVICLERWLGHMPYPMSHNNKGFDIWSVGKGNTTFLIEVKGVGKDADSVRVSRSQIEQSKMNEGAFILAIVETDNERAITIYYLENPYPENLPDIVANISLSLKHVKAGAKKMYGRFDDELSQNGGIRASSNALF